MLSKPRSGGRDKAESPREALNRKFLIDLTDARFSIPENEDVLGFIRRVNPFAHSDVGTVLFELGPQRSRIDFNRKMRDAMAARGMSWTPITGVSITIAANSPTAGHRPQPTGIDT